MKGSKDLYTKELKKMKKPLRLGIIQPSVNVSNEPELYWMVPHDVTIHNARTRVTQITPEGLKETERGAERCVVELADADVDIIQYTCSAKIDYEHDKAFAAGLQKITGIRTVPYTQGIVEGFQALGVRKLAMATPYTKEVDELEKKFYEGAGFEIVNIEGLGIVDNVESGLVSPETWYDFVKHVDRPEAEGLWISCTAVRCIEVLDKLERELKKPVIAANTGALWHMLKVCGYKKPIKGYGKILEMLP